MVLQAVPDLVDEELEEPRRCEAQHTGRLALARHNAWCAAHLVGGDEARNVPLFEQEAHQRPPHPDLPLGDKQGGMRVLLSWARRGAGSPSSSAAASALHAAGGIAAPRPLRRAAGARPLRHCCVERTVGI
eukprot:TRINITY_DN3758_c2_g1_i1.p3 TRINITY_DN3758_c2_g1~~TRINITY_DN3758_c2_g1_i1.p3  ORF type:complete len:131 (-),score=7.43 TRINITY_DN3758_c2_g1_i1:37-429(-)